LLLIIGLGTRWAAFFIVVNTSVAFTFVHRLHLSGEHSGEFAWLYLAAALALFLSGAGKFSVDGLASHGGEHHHRESKPAGRRKFRAAAR
jgi:putative oxidoreductase